jgi:hypothetical protein
MTEPDGAIGDNPSGSPDDSPARSDSEIKGARDLRGANTESRQGGGTTRPDNGGSHDQDQIKADRGQKGDTNLDRPHADRNDSDPGIQGARNLRKSDAESGQTGDKKTDNPGAVDTNTRNPEVDAGRDLRNNDPERVPPGITPPESILPRLGPDLSGLGAPEYVEEDTYLRESGKANDNFPGVREHPWIQSKGKLMDPK